MNGGECDWRHDVSIHLRLATETDINLLYQWANDGDTRKWSLNQDEIDYDDHVQWCWQSMKSETRCLLMAETQTNNGLYFAIGTCRIDHGADIHKTSHSVNRDTERHGRVSITVGPSYRGRGYATPILKSLCSYAEHLNLRSLEAQIKHANAASLSAFCGAGFWVSHNRGDLWTLDYRLSRSIQTI